MELTFPTIYEKLGEIIKGPVVDLSSVTFCDPWAMGMICLLAIERKDDPQKKLILPKNSDVKRYLKRMNFDNFMCEINYQGSVAELRDMQVAERENLNIHEVLHSLHRDDFNARLERVRRMFRNFGMANEDDVNRVTVLVAELGNNVFDHNDGLWPTDVRGAIMIGQNYPTMKKVEVAIADPGIGFKESLKTVNPDLNDVDAIKLGLQGISGRIGEGRGNGLKLIQSWTINKFNGIVKIQSGSGLVVVDENGTTSSNVNRTLGTLASVMVVYN